MRNKCVLLSADASTCGRITTHSSASRRIAAHRDASHRIPYRLIQSVAAPPTIDQEPSAVQKSIHVDAHHDRGTQLESTEKLDVRLAVAQHVRDITRLHDKGGNCSCKCPEGVIDLLSTSHSAAACKYPRRLSIRTVGRASIYITEAEFHVMRPYTFHSSPVEMHGHAELCVVM